MQYMFWLITISIRSHFKQTLSNNHMRWTPCIEDHTIFTLKLWWLLWQRH